MAARVNPDLIKQLAKYGRKEEWNNCFHCGNCTAVCSLTEQGFLFPRKEIRYLQMGLKNKLKTFNEPWLCYYCGDCSDTCPRNANPGELMMTLRRYLTAVYDWTGLAGLFYTSKIALYIAFSLVAITIIIISGTKNFNTEETMDFGHLFEKYAIYTVAILILIPNIIRMYYFTIIKPKVKFTFSAFITGIWDLLFNMFSQKQTLKCTTNQKFRWLEHFLIVIGYLTLLFTTVFLNWFEAQPKSFIWWLGYIVSAIIFIFTFDFVLARMKKNKQLTKYSHTTDWLFVIWLFLIGLTAFLVRIFIDINLINNNLWLYLIHLIILAQWATLIVPFGKWTHFLYRSFAMYFYRLKYSSLK